MDVLVARGFVAVSPSVRSPAPPAHPRRGERTVPRVLVAHPSADNYGSDRQLAESVHGLQAAGWQVTVALPGTGPLVGLLPDVAMQVAPFPVLRKALLSPVALLRLGLRLPVDLVRLVRRIR